MKFSCDENFSEKNSLKFSNKIKFHDFYNNSLKRIVILVVVVVVVIRLIRPTVVNFAIE